MTQTHRAKWSLPLMVSAVMMAGCGGGTGSPTPPVTTPPPPALTTGLVLLMHMDEASWSGLPREVVDSSGLGHHGTALTGAATVAAGKFGRGGSFGASSCVAVADAPDLRPGAQLTIAAWAFPTGLGSGRAGGIITKRIDYLSDSAYAFFFYVDDRMYVDINTEDNRFGGSPALTNGRWYHLAAVYDGSLSAANRVTVYVDGRSSGTGFEAASSITPFSSPMWVGCLAEGGTSQGFLGTLDEVAVWHRALSASEILGLATATTPIPR
jgi:MSHA biogenesis protein MshQ